MALIFGIYEDVIGSASDGVQVGLRLIRGDVRGCLVILKGMRWVLLGPLVIGMIATPFLGAGLLESLLDSEPEIMRGLFFGLIVGSLPIPWLRIREKATSAYLLLLVAGVLAWMLGSLPAGGIADPTYWQVFGAAAVAISAMVLPGVSGAYLLLVFGMYEVTLEALRDLDFAFIGVFGLGAAVGLAGFSVLLNWLLKNHHDATMAVLVGLMVGSLRALWPWQAELGSPMLPSIGDGTGVIILLAVVGLAITGGLSWWELRRSDTEDARTR